MSVPSLSSLKLRLLLMLFFLMLFFSLFQHSVAYSLLQPQFSSNYPCIHVLLLCFFTGLPLITYCSISGINPIPPFVVPVIAHMFSPVNSATFPSCFLASHMQHGHLNSPYKKLSKQKNPRMVAEGKLSMGELWC